MTMEGFLIKTSSIGIGATFVAGVMALQEPWPSFFACVFGVMVGSHFRKQANTKWNMNTILPIIYGFMLCLVGTIYVAPFLYELVAGTIDRLAIPSFWLFAHFATAAVSQPMLEWFSAEVPGKIKRKLNKKIDEIE